MRAIGVGAVVLSMSGLCVHAHAQPLPRTHARRAGHDTIVAFGKPRIIKPRSTGGPDLSDHYGLTTEVTLFATDAGRPSQVAQFKIFTYDVQITVGRTEAGERNRPAVSIVRLGQKLD